MNKKYVFCFDESFHDRRITKNSLFSKQFFTPYVCVGIGINYEKLSNLTEIYSIFEDKYKSKYKVKELKSSIISSKKYKYGLVGLSSDDVEFLFDFFDILSENDVIYYISILDKLEYLLLQCQYKGSINLNIRACVYTISKSINTYKPDEVLESIFNKNSDFIKKIKSFFTKQVEINGNIDLKVSENLAFTSCIKYLDNVDVSSIDFDFSYNFVFEGLRKLIDELNINNDSLVILLDNEGSGRFKKSAYNSGFFQATSLDSEKCQGIRIADILAGFVSRFMHGIYIDTYNNPNQKYDKPYHLNEKWFRIDRKRFDLYKKIAGYFKKYSNVEFSSYLSTYFDLFAEMIEILYYFDSYNSYNDYIKIDSINHLEKATFQILGRIDYHQKRL